VDSIPRILKDEFTVREYVLTALVLPRGYDFPIKESFKDDFKKIDYLPVLMGKKTDIMAAEIIKHYVFTTWLYARLLVSEDKKNANYFYRLAILMANKPLKYVIVEDYTKYIIEKQGVEAAQIYLAELKEAVSDKETKKEIENIVENIERNRTPRRMPDQ
jgi:hypothetical protein